MKSLIILAALAVPQQPPPIAIPADGGVFVVQPATTRAYKNDAGFAQVDAIVDLSTASEMSRSRIGVTGCADGRGQIARVDEGGAPTTSPRQWSVLEARVMDVLALAICAGARPQGEAPATKPGMA